MKIKSQLSRIFNIYDEDWKPLLTLMIFIVVICAIIANLKTVSNALFVAKIGAKNLPLTYIGCAITLIFLGLILLPLIDKMQRHSVYILTVTALSVFVLYSYAMIAAGQNWIYFFLYIIAYIMDTILFLEFWLIASDICDARQSKRVFPLIIGWSLVGGMIGAFGTKFLVKYFKTVDLLLISAAALISTIFIILLIKIIFPKEIAFETKTHKGGGISKLERFKMDINILKEYPLLKYICVSFILYSFLTYLLDFQFNIAASAHFSADGKVQTEKLTAFYGMFDGICISSALFFQFFIANRFLNSFGVANSQMVLPAVFTAGFGSIFLNLIGIKPSNTQPFYSTILTRLGQKVTSSSIYRSSYNLLYNPISKEKRGRSKTFSESLIQPVGVLLVGISILFMKKLSLYIICGISIGISVYYIINILKLKKAYIKSILSMFDSKNYSQIESFAGLFGKLGEKEILNKLYEVINDNDFNIRCFIVEILGEINNKGTAEPLAGLFTTEENVKVKASIVKVLGKLGGAKAVSIIKQAVDDHDPRIRSNSVEAIALLKSPDLYPLIPEKLKDPHHRVKATAAITILQLNLEKHRQEAVDTLVKMFEKGGIEDKISAIYAFGAAGGEDFLEYIIKAVNSTDTRIIRRAILSLGQTKTRKAAEVLIDFIRAANASSLKNLATQSLITAGKNARPPILSALKDPDVYERKYLIKALSIYADNDLREPLLKTVFEELESARQNTNCVEKLETIPQKESVIILLDSLKNVIAEARENVLNIITILCGNTESIKSIVKNLHHPNRFQRANALEALENIGEKEIVKQTIPLIEPPQRTGPSEYSQEESLKTLGGLLKSNYGWIRASTVFSLGRLKAVELKEEILKMTEDSDDLTRANTIEALKYMGGKENTDLFKNALKDPSPRVRAYAEAAIAAQSQ